MDLGSFTRRGLMVDRVRPAETWVRGSTEKAEGVRSEGKQKKTDNRPVCNGKEIGP